MVTLNKHTIRFVFNSYSSEKKYKTTVSTFMVFPYATKDPKGINSRACFSRARFKAEMVYTVAKNRDDFHCMQMTLMMTMRSILDDD